MAMAITSEMAAAYMAARLAGQPAEQAHDTARLATATGVPVAFLASLVSPRRRPVSFRSAREVRAARKAERDYCSRHDC